MTKFQLHSMASLQRQVTVLISEASSTSLRLLVNQHLHLALRLALILMINPELITETGHHVQIWPADFAAEV